MRPISGFTQKDETKDGRQSSVSKGVAAAAMSMSEGGGNGEEGEDNYHKFAVLELEDQRKAIKM